MDALQRLVEADAITRLRNRDAGLFADDADERMHIMQRLGWTDLADKASARLPLLDNLAKAVVGEGATDILLLGMGGSSLAPLVISRVIGSAPGMPRLHVLDTTSPTQVRATLDALEPARTFAIVASKSGTTIEPLALYAIVREWLETAMERPVAGRHCIAITDQGSPLEKLRQREVMRVALQAPATVGGRYSALSMFGLAPAALIGVDMPAFIERAAVMEAACAAPAPSNPGALLAAWIADAHAEGRDKLTVVCSEALAPFGLWVEQLVAESLGKRGVGVVPVLEYDQSVSSSYGTDRAVVFVRLAEDEALTRLAADLGPVFPVFECVCGDPLDIAAEFVRWENAVALAGFLLGVNPFDEPNVTEAKKATTAILQGGAGDVPKAHADIGGTWLTFAGGLATPSPVPGERPAAIRHALAAAADGEYVALLVYAPEDGSLVPLLERAASDITRATGRAVCLQLGPRYLHSTGQLHKGGPDSGVFVLVTARDRTDIAVPGHRFTLAALNRAQAEGDLVTLARHGRRVLRLDLPALDTDAVASLARDLSAAAT